MTLDQWIASTEALLELDAKGALAPHGIGGHARKLLDDALARLRPAVTSEQHISDEIERRVALITDALLHLPILFDELQAAARQVELALRPDFAALASPITEKVAEGCFQDRVAQAHVALFHDDPTDLAERRDRFGEEANELQQALGQTREAAHQLVDYTYDRPVGETKKEIGAAALTLASLCVVGGWDMTACAEADLAALQTPEKIAKVRAKRATRHGRGPLPGIDAALTPSTSSEGKP